MVRRGPAGSRGHARCATQARASQEDRNRWTEEMLRGVCAKYRVPNLVAVVDVKD